MVNVRFSSYDELNAIVDEADRLPSYSNHILNSENISSLRNCLRNVEVFHAYEENTSVDKFVTLTIFKAKRDDDFEYFDIYPTSSTIYDYLNYLSVNAGFIFANLKTANNKTGRCFHTCLFRCSLNYFAFSA